MKRRSFLSHSTLATLAAWIPVSWVSGIPAENQVYAEPDLLHIVNDPDKVHGIGQSYRISFPEFDCVDRLRNELYTSAGNVRQAIKRRVQHDFEQGNIVQVEGWILSVTEARQCALFSLLHG